MILSSVDAIEETPVDRYLREQRDLSAVDRFSRFHDLKPGHGSAVYRDLLPATPPAPGEQYAFEVDLDACTGCKACVTACHALNGLDDDETWRTVHAYHGIGQDGPWHQTVTAACHHCVEPACLAGCPVDAYEKDPVTGIVVHLDDQCIGCSYCTLTCPYEVPAFNHRLGIVRKCDMCRGRLAANEAPACVQGCPNGAIRVSVVSVADVVARADAVRVPGGPPSTVTMPSTRYHSARAPKVAERRHLADPGVHRSHMPLVVMLVLTQLAVGALAVDVLLRRVGDVAHAAGVAPFDALLALVAGAVALAASVFHLGRPRYAYRAVIGLRHSWLSREVVAFGGFTSLAAAYAAVVLLGPVPRTSPLVTALGAVAAVSGIVAVACSAAVYVVTHRDAWRPRYVAPAFASTTMVCGLAGVLWASTLARAIGVHGVPADTSALREVLPTVLGVVVALQLLWEARVTWRLCSALEPGAGVERHLEPDLRVTVSARRVAAFVGGAALIGLVAATAADLTWVAFVAATLAVAAFVVGELYQRILFFELSAPPR